MNCRYRYLATLSTISIAILLSPTVRAQNPNHWPTDLSQQSSVTEIMNWLDKTSFAQARVGIRTMSRGASQNDFVPMLSQDALPNYSLFFAEGFKLVQVSDCGVILQNDDTTMIDHSDMVSDSKPAQRLRAEIYVPLYRMSVTSGRPPYRHTKDPKKSGADGTWRTQYKTNRPREDVLLTLYVPGKTDKAVWEADVVTFTFENKETSERFDTVFRHAIRLCQKKK